MEKLTLFVPEWGSPEDWNEAYEKVENYLRACRINSRLHRARLIHRILERVASQGPVAEGLPFSTRAIRETQQLMEQWFNRLLQPADTDGAGYSLVDGRVGLLLCDGAARWPYAFLASGDLPPEFVKVMRASMLRAGPNIEISSMVPRPIDFGWFPEIAGDTLESLGRIPLLKALIVWGLFLVGLAAIFWITRQ